MKNISLKTTLILFFGYFISHSSSIVHAQSAGISNIVWQKCLGGTREDIATDIKPTSDNGYIVVGYSNSNDGDVTGHHGDLLSDYWIVKLDNSGNIQWSKSYGGSQEDEAFAVHQTPDDGYIVVGHSQSSDGDVTDHHSGSTVRFDVWILKLYSNGTIQWSKSYGGTSTDGAYDIALTSDGGYIVAGYADSDDGDLAGNVEQGSGDYWVIKLDGNGNIQWDRNYFGNKIENSAELDFAKSIAETSDGNYIVSGYCRSCDSHPNQENLWMLKIKSDGTGDTIWTHIYGGTGGDGTSAIMQTSTGNYVSIGNTHSKNGDANCNTSGKHEMWVIKTNSFGNKITSFPSCFGGTGEDEGYDIIEAGDGTYILAGDTKSTDEGVACNHGDRDMWLINVDSSDGHIIWQQTLGGTHEDLANAVAATFDGKLIAAGYTMSSNGDVSGHHGLDGTSDYWVVKLKPSGGSCGLPQNLVDTNITCNSATLQWDVVPCATSYRVQYRIKGPNPWITKDLPGNSLTLNGLQDNTIYQWHLLNRCKDGNGKKVQGAYTPNQTFVTPGCKLAANVNGNSFSVYPNPAADRFTISLTSNNSSAEDATIELINPLGQVVLTEKATLNEGELNKSISIAQQFSWGLYHVRVIIGNVTYDQHLLIE